MRARLTGRFARRTLDGVWWVASLPSERADSPEQLPGADPTWIECSGPMTAARALRDAGRLDPDRPPDFDADDWWFRCRFRAGDRRGGERLRFDGIATLAEVWVNGIPVASSDNMFVSQSALVGALLGEENELLIRCRSLNAALAKKRPRGKWKTKLVSHQQLRWHRTTLLGRIPAWCPPIAPVGPWRPVWFEPPAPVSIGPVRVTPELRNGSAVVSFEAEIGAAPGVRLGGAELRVGLTTAALSLEPVAGGGARVRGEVVVADAKPWWPRTHGDQPRYSAALTILADGEPVEVDLGRIGFRALDVDRGPDGAGFGLRVNGVDVFCRGACWTPLDLARLGADGSAYRTALELARDAGMNMMRVGGATVYEDDAFYEACDDLGILVWQDFMFANMDYPAGNPAFVASVELEATQFLDGMQGRPSLAVLCGGSEVEQQAAMLGLPSPAWTNELFERMLPDRSAEQAPGVPWVRSSPSGGALPFQIDHGVSHYYGVGAYLRPLEDARRANVRFTSECLGFSNVPEPEMVERVLAEGEAAPTHPKWKAGVPRDRAVGWDFEDVRDHYVKVLFGVDPTAARYRDADRYLTLGRATTGEVIGRTIAEWRRPGSTCRGALVWFFRDLQPGAGWGVVDSNGAPKAAWWYFRRAARPVVLLLSDEGLNGLAVSVVNETGTEVAGTIRLTAYREGRAVVARASREVRIPGRGSVSLNATSWFDRFLDLSYAFRFGPPGHDAVVARFEPETAGVAPATQVYRPLGLSSERDPELALTAAATATETGWRVTLRSSRIAHAVRLETPGFRPDDNYFDLEPDTACTVLLTGAAGAVRLQGTAEAVNGPGPVPIQIDAA